MGRYRSRARRASDIAADLERAAMEIRDTKDVAAANEILNDLSLDDKDALQEEMESWRDGMQGTNLERTGKYGEVEECAGALAAIDLGFDEVTDADEIEGLAERLEEAAGELEAVEFPGMF